MIFLQLKIHECKISQPVCVSHHDLTSAENTWITCIFSYRLGDFTFCVIHVFSADVRSWCETHTGWEILHSCIFSCRKIMSDVNRLGDFTICTIHVFSATGWEILLFVLFMYFTWSYVSWKYTNNTKCKISQPVHL
jgi:hypothetical protein